MCGVAANEELNESTVQASCSGHREAARRQTDGCHGPSCLGPSCLGQSGLGT